MLKRGARPLAASGLGAKEAMSRPSVQAQKVAGEWRGVRQGKGLEYELSHFRAGDRGSERAKSFGRASLKALVSSARRRVGADHLPVLRVPRKTPNFVASGSSKEVQ